MKHLSLTWQKFIVWVTAYLNVVAFFLAGGYLFLHAEGKEIRRSAKTAFAVTVAFGALRIARTMLYRLLVLVDASRNTLIAMEKVAVVLLMLQAAAYCVLLVLDVFGCLPQIFEKDEAPAEIAPADEA